MQILGFNAEEQDVIFRILASGIVVFFSSCCPFSILEFEWHHSCRHDRARLTLCCPLASKRMKVVKISHLIIIYLFNFFMILFIWNTKVLHLGNVFFHREALKHGQEGVKMGSDVEVRWVSHLLQLRMDGIVAALTTKTTVRSSWFDKPSIASTFSYSFTCTMIVSLPLSLFIFIESHVHVTNSAATGGPQRETSHTFEYWSSPGCSRCHS